MSNKKLSLDERKKYACYLGEQEMDTVEFTYQFKYVDVNGERVRVTEDSTSKFTAKEAWMRGLVNAPPDSELVEVREVVTASGAVEKPEDLDGEETTTEEGSGDKRDAADIPEDPPPPKPKKRGG